MLSPDSLGAELTSTPASSIVTDILALRKQLAILVSPAKPKKPWA